ETCTCLFFFHAEDGIRDFHVTGVQTCALPIYFDSRFPWYRRIRRYLLRRRVRTHLVSGIEFQMAVFIIGPLTGAIIPAVAVAGRSEERRVGKGCRSRGAERD